MQRIVVHNFGPLRDVDIKINDFTILIGEQASGKSTLAKLIYFFRTLKDDILLEADKLDGNANVTNIAKDLIINKLQNKFALYFGFSSGFDLDFNIKFYFEDNGNNSKFIELLRNPSLKIRFGQQNTFFNEIVASVLRFKNSRDSQRIRAGSGLLSLFDTLRSDLNRLFDDNYKPFYLPAGRNITVSYGEQIDKVFYGEITKMLPTEQSINAKIDLFLMQEFIEECTRFRTRFNNRTFADLSSDKSNLSAIGDKTNEILKGTYRNTNGTEEIIIAGRLHPVPLSQASTGQQESIRILQDIFLSIADDLPTFKIIEEPEAHLYPKAQKHIVEVLSLSLQNRQSQILITTHSPYILSVCNNLLYARRITNRFGHLNESINNVIDEQFWLDPDRFAAFALQDGCAESIFNTNTGLIRQNYLDQIFAEMGLEYRRMHSFYAEQIMNTQNV